MPSTVHRQCMTQVTKFNLFILWYISLECHWNEQLYLIHHHTAGRTCNLHVRWQGLIQEFADVKCPLLVQEVDMFQ